MFSSEFEQKPSEFWLVPDLFLFLFKDDRFSIQLLLHLLPSCFHGLLSYKRSICRNNRTTTRYFTERQQGAKVLQGPNRTESELMTKTKLKYSL